MVFKIVVAQTTGEALGFRSRSMCSMRDPPDSYRPLYLQTLPNSLHPLPRETVRRANPRHFDQFPRLRCAVAITNYHSTFGDVDDRPGTHLSIVLVNQGSIGARLLCVFARRARRANRAQSTAQH